MKVQGIFSVFGHVARGLTSELTRLQTVAENISNANQVAGDGEPIYHRKRVDPQSFKEEFQSRLRGKSLAMRRSNEVHFRGTTGERRFQGGKWPVAKIIESPNERLVFDPTHPKANTKGYVRVPDVNVVEEMMEMITATRSYEANTSVLTAAKQMAKRTLDL